VLGFNRIVLSRKGFDSSAGGGFSPFDPETGKYIVLPIPQGAGKSYIGNKLKYEEIKIENNYFQRCSTSNLKELMEKTDRWPPKIKGKNPEYAHFDPWLVRCPWLSKDSDHNIGAFGQVGGAQGVLNNRCVATGSLFLFFSGFKSIKESKFDCIDINAQLLHREGAYFIYGWLRVGGEPIISYDEINSKINEPKLREALKERHPHATQAYFDKVDPFRRKKLIQFT